MCRCGEASPQSLYHAMEGRRCWSSQGLVPDSCLWNIVNTSANKEWAWQLMTTNELHVASNLCHGVVLPGPGVRSHSAEALGAGASRATSSRSPRGLWHCEGQTKMSEGHLKGTSISFVSFVLFSGSELANWPSSKLGLLRKAAPPRLHLVPLM